MVSPKEPATRRSVVTVTENKMDRDLRPLADRMRPRCLEEFFGQSHLLGSGKPLTEALAGNAPHSMVFWGPPGSGKTTLARLLATRMGARFEALSAVLAGVKDIRAIVAIAQQELAAGHRTVLFVDEVHRFNKSQQDAFLPHVEDGTLLFIGATTENPSFELNNALLSRSRVYVLQPLTGDEIAQVVEAAIVDRERGLGSLELRVSEEAREIFCAAADGDARRALNLLEIAADLATEQADGPVVTAAVANAVAADTRRRFDKGGEVFYDQISALHKSVRGSDPDAALYWLARMLDGGCDPLYIARRVLRMASEDIGNADPRALRLALDAWDVQQRLGSPEGELAIAQAVVFLACAAKSNAVYTAFAAARSDVSEHGSLEVPLHLRNAPTRLMRELDYGKGYRYSHDEPEGYAAGQEYFPAGISRRQYYRPTAQGLEQKISEKLARLRRLDTAARADAAKATDNSRDPNP